MTSSPPTAAHQPWRDVLKVHPAAELFPLMGEAELRELGEDIKQNGLTIPIVIGHRDKHDGQFKLWDGRNRLDALEALGLLAAVKQKQAEDTAPTPQWRFFVKRHPGLWPLPVNVVREDEGNEPYTYIVSANLHRRHLTAEQRRELIAKLLKAKPTASNNTIAKQVKANDKTVAKVRRKLESTSEIPKLTKTVGADGKSRSKPKKRTKIGSIAKTEPIGSPPVRYSEVAAASVPAGLDPESVSDSTWDSMLESILESDRDGESQTPEERWQIASPISRAR
jgi:hypothetical protein